VIRLSGALPLERAGIPLHDAPERYSDQEKWGEIVRIVGNRDAALAFVSRYTSGDFRPLALFLLPAAQSNFAVRRAIHVH
jgi:hypothetical protein